MELPPEAIALLDELANAALTSDTYTKGLVLRAKSPLGKKRVDELLESLTPSMLQREGARPDDHYRIKPRGILNSTRRKFFLSVAADLRDVIIEQFHSDPEFSTIRWEQVIEFFKTRGRDTPLSPEGARYVFTCIGAWAGGGTTRQRPLAEMLEKIVDTDVSIGQLLKVVDLHLFPSTPLTEGMVFTSTLVQEPLVPGKVFLIHGQNHTLRDKMQIHLAIDLGLKVEVMEAGANRGRTLPEKFEQIAAECAYAVCILSGDDDVTVHSPDGDKRVRRARQNAVLELGHFWALVGRENVAVLYERGVELPSDISGLAWIEITSDLGKTKLDLQKELRQAGLLR